MREAKVLNFRAAWKDDLLRDTSVRPSEILSVGLDFFLQIIRPVIFLKNVETMLDREGLKHVHTIDFFLSSEIQ